MLSQNGLHSFEDELFFCNCAQRWDLPVFHPLFFIKLYRQTETIFVLFWYLTLTTSKDFDNFTLLKNTKNRYKVIKFESLG